MRQQPYHELIVWKEAHAFCLLIYKITSTFPKHELFAVTAQIRRAAVSIPANIVEGYAKQSTQDFLRYLNIAEDSSKECAYFLELSRDLQYLDIVQFELAESARSKVDYLLKRLKTGVRGRN